MSFHVRCTGCGRVMVTGTLDVAECTHCGAELVRASFAEWEAQHVPVVAQLPLGC